MRTSLHDRVLNAVNRSEIPRHVQREVVNAICNPPKKGVYDLGTLNPAWKALIDSAKHARLSMVSNKSKWPTHSASIYTEYTDLISTAVTKMESARLTTGEDARPTQLADFTKHVHKLNSTRMAAGRLLLGTCDSRWQSWIPDKTREAFIKTLAHHYADCPEVRMGNRLIPFAPAAMRRDNKQRMAKIRAALESVRRACSGDKSGGTPGSTPYAALYLSAARMAEMAADAYAVGVNDGTFNPYERPCPVNWLHLLTPGKRTQLRRAEVAPELIDVESVSYFLSPGTHTMEMDEAVNARVAALVQVDADAAAEWDGQDD